jgi:hypothetical protein
MTWCSEDSATPRFALASSAIRCRFVDRFVRLRVLSRVSRQRFSSHDTLFPRSGPGESGSPMSAIILRCYDFPARIPGHLFVSLPGSTLPSSVRVSRLALALALPEGRRVPSGPSQCLTGDPIAGLLSRGRERDLPGSQAIHPVPLPRSTTPAESTMPRLLTVSSMLPPLGRQ